MDQLRSRLSSLPLLPCGETAALTFVFSASVALAGVLLATMSPPATGQSLAADASAFAYPDHQSDGPNTDFQCRLGSVHPVPGIPQPSDLLPNQRVDTIGPLAPADSMIELTDEFVFPADISDSYAVWRGSKGDIHIYDVEEQKRTTLDSTTLIGLPSPPSDRIRINNQDLYWVSGDSLVLYNLNSENVILMSGPEDLAYQESEWLDATPLMSNRWLLWLGMSGDQLNLYKYDRITGQTGTVSDRVRSVGGPSQEQAVTLAKDGKIRLHDLQAGAAEVISQTEGAGRSSGQRVSISRNWISWVEEGKEANPDIYLYNANDGSKKQLTRTREAEGWPYLHGQNVLFVRGHFDGTETLRGHLYLRDIVTGQEHKITHNDIVFAGPTFAMSGRGIIWYREHPFNEEGGLYLIPLREPDSAPREPDKVERRTETTISVGATLRPTSSIVGAQVQVLTVDGDGLGPKTTGDDGAVRFPVPPDRVLAVQTVHEDFAPQVYSPILQTGGPGTDPEDADIRVDLVPFGAAEGQDETTERTRSSWEDIAERVVNVAMKLEDVKTAAELATKTSGTMKLLSLPGALEYEFVLRDGVPWVAVKGELVRKMNEMILGGCHRTEQGNIYCPGKGYATK